MEIRISATKTSKTWSLWSMVRLTIEIMVQALIFILPAYVANGTPTIFGRGGTPMDGGRVFPLDGRRLLGDGKTWQGFFGGIISGTVVAILEMLFSSFGRNVFAQFGIDVSPVLYGEIGMVIIGALLSIGTLLGDMIGSFIKRRLNLKRGHPAIGLDQLGFLITALILSAPFIPTLTPISYDIFWLYALFLIPVTFIVHITANVISYLVGLKNVPY